MRTAPRIAQICATIAALLVLASIAGCGPDSVVSNAQDSALHTEGQSSTSVNLSPPVPASPQRSKSDFSLIPPISSVTSQPHAPSLPPVLLETVPPDGAAWDGSPIVFLFDQPLAEGSAHALAVEPSLPGIVTVSGSELTFNPDAAPRAGTRYRFILGEEVSNPEGLSLAAPVAVTLAAAVPLQVTSTQPANGMEEVATNSQIVIAFNRPVVPLVGVDHQMDLAQPFTIVPPIDGNGRWLNTSVYAFEPDAGFAGSTAYEVTIGDIAGLGGEQMSEPYSISFVTAAPIVRRSSPNGTVVRPDATVSLTFSQPMDPLTTSEAFRLQRLNQNAPPVPIEGDIRWNDAGTVLKFMPASDLSFGGMYQIEVTTEAQPASRQGSLRSVYHSDFTVVPLPAIKSVTPVDGTDGVAPDSNVVISFNTAVSPTLAAEQVTVTPLLSTTQVFSYYSHYDNRLQLSWFKEPGTRYTVTVGGEIADEYGNTLGEDYLFSFSTGDHSPFIRLETDRVTHYSAYTETRVSLLYRNIDRLDVELFSVPDRELFELTGDNQRSVWDEYQIPDRDSNRIWQRTYETGEEKNVTIRQIVTITDESGNVLPPGAYLLEVAHEVGAQHHSPPARDGSVDPAKRSQALIFLSNNNLVLKRSQQGPSLAWLTDLRTGQPISGENISFFAGGAPAGEGITDADGIVSIALDVDEERQWAPVLAMSGDSGEMNYAIASSEWNSGIATWDFGLSGGWGADQVTAYFYTDRPIYRPGQTVYWKGIVRELEDDQYQLPPPRLPVYVEVRDDLGNVISMDEAVLINEHGTLNGHLNLSPEAIAGYYYIEARVPLDDGRYSFQGASFQVASYRKPEFEISLTSELPEYVQGETARVTARASYFSGGPLADAEVTWRIISQPYFFAWADGPDDRHYRFAPFDPEQGSYDPYSGSLALGLVREGSGRTNDNGEFVIDVPADLGQALQSQRWLIDITVQSPTNQFVSDSVSIPIHGAGVYVGLSTASYVSRVAEETAIDIVTVKPDGAPFRAAEIGVTVFEYEWNSVYERAADGSHRWESSVVRTPVFSTTTTSDRQGYAVVHWTPTAGTIPGRCLLPG